MDTRHEWEVIRKGGSSSAVLQSMPFLENPLPVVRVGRWHRHGRCQVVGMPSPRRVLVVGGVAGGASCAARLRRLDESSDIVVFDRGPFVSFANCGLPFYVGDVIEDEGALLMASPDLFRQR